MNLKKIFILSLVLLFASQPVFSCPFPRPNFYSLKESNNDQVLVSDSNDDWAFFLPGGDLKAYYTSSFQTFSGEKEDAAQAYLAAKAFEDKGQYKEASEIYRKIDKARKSIWEWAGSVQMQLLYEAKGSNGEKNDSEDDSTSESESFLPQAGPWRIMEASYHPQVNVAQAVKKAKHRKAPKYFSSKPASQNGLYPAFQVHGLDVPPTGAWAWMRGRSEETTKPFRLSFQEAAIRVEIYSDKFLNDPKGMAEYLKARKYFLDGKYQDCLGFLAQIPPNNSTLGQEKSELKFLCGLRMTNKPDDIKDKIDEILARQNSPKLLLNIGLAYLQDETTKDSRKQAEKYFSSILTSFPKSRYADDACYLLAKIGILQKNWKKAGSSFRKLGNKYNTDDMVAFGGLAGLASMAKSYFDTPTFEDAFWKLAGGPGAYDSEKSNLELIAPVFRPYLMLWRSEKTNDDSKKDQLLETIAKSKTESCIRREALFLLATKYRLANQLGYGQKGPGIEIAKDFSLKFLESYPEDPRAPYMLSQAWGFFPDTHSVNQQLAKIIENMSNYHNLTSLNPFGTRKNISIPPFGKNETLNLKCFIDSNRFLDVIEQYPQSPWAFPALIQVSVDQKQARESLRAIEKYKEWSQNQPDFKKEWNDILNIKLATAEMMNSHWEKALDQADRFLGTGRPNRYMDEALWVRAKCLEKLGRTTQAEKTYESLIKQYPEGANAEKLEEMFSYGQQPPQPTRGDKASPYTLFAYQKVLKALERDGDWDRALDIYLKLGYQRDLALTLDFDMPIDAFAKYIKDHPETTQSELLHYSLAMRYFRQNDFVNALSLLPDTPDSSGITLTPTPGPKRHKRLRDEIVASNAKELRDTIGLTKAYYDTKAGAQTDDAKSTATYDLGRFYFYRGRVLYYNTMLWNGLWFNDSEGPLNNQKPTDDSYHLPFLHYRDAGYQFYQIIKNYPQSSIRDRALYSYALCFLKPNFGNDRYVAPDDPVTNVSDLFYRVAQQYPQSPLADDALFWSGYRDRDNVDKYYSEILKNYQDGDVLKFFPPDQLLKAMKEGVGSEWRPDPFASHNQNLRSPLEPTSQPVLANYSYSEKIEPGKPYSGWLYYRSPGGLVPYKGIFHMDFKGLDETPVEVNFSGKVVQLPKGKQKLFALEDPNWPPNVTKWIYFKIDSLPSQDAQGTHYLEIQKAGETLATEKSEIPLVNSIKQMTLSQTTQPIPELSHPWNYFYLCAKDGKTLWAACQNGTLQALLILCDAQGKPIHSIPVQPYNCFPPLSFHVQWLEDDSVLFFPSNQGGVKADAPVFQWFWSSAGATKNFYLPGKGYWPNQVHYQTGEVVDSNNSNLGKLPQPLAVKEVVNQTNLNLQRSNTPNEAVKEIKISNAKGFGFDQDDISIRLETTDKGFWLKWIGQDTARRIYLLILERDGPQGQSVLVLDPSGKIISEPIFPAVPANPDIKMNSGYVWGADRFAYVVLPEGGIQREYLTDTPKPSIVVDKLSFQ